MESVRAVGFVPPQKKTIRTVQPQNQFQPVSAARFAGTEQSSPKKACSAGICSGVTSFIGKIFRKISELFSSLIAAIRGTKAAPKQDELPPLDLDKAKENLEKQFQEFFKDGKLQPEVQDYLEAHEIDYDDIKSAFDVDSPEKEQALVKDLITEGKSHLDIVADYRQDPDSTVDKILAPLLQQVLVHEVAQHPALLEQLNKAGVNLNDFDHKAIGKARQFFPAFMMKELEESTVPGIRDAFKDDLEQLEAGNFKKFLIYALMKLDEKVNPEQPEEASAPVEGAETTQVDVPAVTDGNTDGAKAEISANPFGIDGKNRNELVKALRGQAEPAGEDTGLGQAFKLGNSLIALADSAGGLQKFQNPEGQPVFAPELITELQKKPLSHNTAQKLVTILKDQGHLLLARNPQS